MKQGGLEIRLVLLLALSVAWIVPGPDAAVEPGPDPGPDPGPSVLIHCARITPDQWSWWVDLRYLTELHDRGFEVDYTDRHEDFTWERLRRYDVLVLYSVPLRSGAYFDNTPDRPPYRDVFVRTVERFLEAGGSVLLMARSLNADETFLPLIERWGGRIPRERIVESDATRLASMPRMGARQQLWLTDGVPDSPVSDGVEQVWLPITAHYGAAETMPIEVDDSWTVVLRGTATSRTRVIEPSGSSLVAPPDARVRGGGVEQPDLCAIRHYKAGRLAFCAMWPQYSLGQGTEWLYERRVLSRGFDERPSHFGRLLDNMLRWLSEPGVASDSVGGYVTDRTRLVAPNRRENVGTEFVRRGQHSDFRPEVFLDRARPAGPLLRGLIGARTSLSGGSGRVEDYARAARASGLDFVVFLEDSSRLEPATLDRLRSDCARHSGPDLMLYPGYRVETNTENRMFLFGADVELPKGAQLAGGRLNQQFQTGDRGAFADGEALIDWLWHRQLRSRRVNAGYYGFADRENAQRVSDLRLYSMVALRLYRDGDVVEDNLDEYLRTAAGTLPPVPVAVHLVDSPAALATAARESVGLTWAQSASLDKLWNVLGYARQYRAPNVFESDGPRIEVWPAVTQLYTLAAERATPAASWMPSPLIVTSEVGLREVRIYDGDRLFRRFLPEGEKRFELTLELSASIQRTLVVVAEDVSGGRAVSTARRAWKGGDLGLVFCGDRINHCDRAPLLARGPGAARVSRTPLILGGETWDGGPRGQLPIFEFYRANRPILEGSKGDEGGLGLANRPRLEIADEGAVRVRVELDRLYEPGVPVQGPWRTYGPLGGPTRWFRSEVIFTAFNRPTLGPLPSGPLGFAERGGAEVSLYENHVTFLQGQKLDSLILFAQRPYSGPQSVTLALGRGKRVKARHDLSPTNRRVSKLAVQSGEWFAVYGPEGTNASFHLNRGAPLEILFRRRGPLHVKVAGAVSGETVAPGDQRTFELLSVVDPVDSPQRGIERVKTLARWLRQPGGLEVTRGGLVDPESPGGLVEIRVDDGAASLRIARPSRPTHTPLPLRVRGLNPRFSAGVWQDRGYSLGNYGTAEGRYRPAAVDIDGRVWESLFPDHAPTTEVRIGHPVVCDQPELFVQVTRRHDGDDPASWHVSVNNPTGTVMRATFRTPMSLPGLVVNGRTVDVPPGGYVVLQGDGEDQ